MSPVLDSIGSVKGYGWGAFGIASGYYSIQTLNANGSVNSITFSDIPQDYKHLEIIGQYTDGGQNGLYMRLNGVTSASYSAHYFLGVAAVGGAQSGGSASTNQIWAGTVAYGGTDTSTSYAFTTIRIPEYASTTKLKTSMAYSGWTSGSALNKNVEMDSGMLRSTNPITSITLFMTSAFSTGTSFSLYGVY